MSFNTSSAYPRQMTGASGADGLWKSMETQGQTNLDAGDQYGLVDRVFAKTLSQLSIGSQLTSPCSFVAPKRFTIVVDEIGIIPKTVKIIMAKGKLIYVIGMCHPRPESGIHTPREFRKAYQLPHYVSNGKLVPLFTEYGHLVIEIPLMDSESNSVGGGRFGGSDMISPLNDEGGSLTENVINTCGMGPREGMAPFNRTSGYPNIDYSSALYPGDLKSGNFKSSQCDWKTLDGASMPEWDEPKFACKMKPFDTRYKNYEF